jgi:predicted ATPase
VKAHRMVTLTGVGGVGKTRLALEVATNLVDEFPDGVWFFELAAVVDPAAVPDAVAAVLGITQQPGKTVSESVAAALEKAFNIKTIRQLGSNKFFAVAAALVTLEEAG